MIVLKCAALSGSAAFPSELIEGLPVPERRYDIANGEITLDGYAESVLHHDMLTLLSMPDGLYRPMTPSEQNARTQAARLASTVEEVAPVTPAKKQVGG